MSDDVTPDEYVEKETIPFRPEKLPHPPAQVSKGVPMTFRKTGERTRPNPDAKPKPPREKTPPVPYADCEHPNGALQWVGPHNDLSMFCGCCMTTLTGAAFRQVQTRMKQEREARAAEAARHPFAGNAMTSRYEPDRD